MKVAHFLQIVLNYVSTLEHVDLLGIRLVFTVRTSTYPMLPMILNRVH